jgi:hypothetical protein
VNRRDDVADTAPNETPRSGPGSLAAPCRHLRTNGMYIFDGASDGTDDDDYEPSACWCLQTMKSFGPDDDLVGRRECRDSGRPCYEPL